MWTGLLSEILFMYINRVKGEDDSQQVKAAFHWEVRVEMDVFFLPTYLGGYYYKFGQHLVYFGPQIM